MEKIALTQLVESELAVSVVELVEGVVKFQGPRQG